MKNILIAGLLSIAPIFSYAAGFTVSSTDMVDGQTLSRHQVFKGFGCDGDNIAPQLSWSGAPAGTKSFAITAYDPDAPTGSGWWHWTVVNLPANTSSLPTGGALPAGAVQGRTDYGQAGFGGACPPAGDKPHRYQFTVWALGVDHLPLDANASGAMVGYMLNVNVLGKAQLTAPYGR